MAAGRAGGRQERRAALTLPSLEQPGSQRTPAWSCALLKEGLCFPRALPPHP